MQINNSNNVNFSIQSLKSNALSKATPQKRQAVEVVNDREQQQTSKQNSANRLNIDEQAIAVLERENESRQQASAYNSSNNTNSDSAGYDKPTAQNISAVNTYESVGNLEQRENVKQLLGVDLFA